MKKVENRMNNEGSIAQRGVESSVALSSHIHWCPQLCGVLAIKTDLMMHMTKWGPGACGKIKITKTLRRPARVWNPILKQTSIDRDLNKCQRY